MNTVYKHVSYPRFEQKDKSKENAYLIFQRKKNTKGDISQTAVKIGILLKGCYLIYLDLFDVCGKVHFLIYNI